METLLEQQRRYHEERERLMDATVKEMLQPSKAVMANFSTCCLLYISINCEKQYDLVLIMFISFSVAILSAIMLLISCNP